MKKSKKPSTAPSEEQIDAVLDAVLDLAPADRRAHAQALCGEDKALWQAIEAILEIDLHAGDFLENTPAASTQARDEQAMETRPGTQIGAWEVVRRIGRGGMGEVLEVRRADGQYEMRAALKRLHEDGKEHVDRLARERQILAALRHPNIAALLDGGVDDDGRPWMVMEYVKGETLDRWAVGKTLPARLAVFRQVVEAINHAHGQLVIHRDIKPANILVDANGHAQLLDFGIAKLLNALHTRDRTQALATPNYAAPEQLLGEPIAVHADIYGLGACLYFLLSGHPPLDLDGQSLPAIIDRIKHQLPVALNQRTPDVPPDLEAICMKCLAKKPAERYSNAASLAEDLTRYEEGFPVRARVPGRWDYLRHYLRRNRATLGAAALILLALAGGLALTTFQAERAKLERDAARQEARRMAGMRTALSTLFREAVEADTSLTSRELFARATEEADSLLLNDPATAGALLQMLGHLQLQAEDYPASHATLRRVLNIPSQAISPVVLADTHLDLAHLEFRNRAFEAVREHMQKAQAAVLESDTTISFQLQLATLESQLARAEGRMAEALAKLESAVEIARNYWGNQHPETAILLVNLGATRYYSGDIDGAIDASEKAFSIYQAIGEDQSPDALNLLANWGVYALRAGHPLEAERRLTRALETRTELYGASAAQAVLMKNLGLAHRINGRKDDGMDLLEQSQWMAERYAGANSHLHVSGSCALARARLADGDSEGTLQALAALPDQVFSQDTYWAHFCTGLRLLAESASADISEPLRGLASHGPRRLNYHAELLAAQGRRLRDAGLPDAAYAALAQAADEKSRVRGPQHFETLMLRIEAAEQQRLLEGQEESARRDQSQALDDLRQSIGPNHPLVELYADRLEKRVVP